MSVNRYTRVHGAYMRKAKGDKHAWKEVRQLMLDKGLRDRQILDALKEFGTRVYGTNATRASCQRTYPKLNEFKEWLNNY